jgi:hypothetical protein
LPNHSEKALSDGFNQLGLFVLPSYDLALVFAAKDLSWFIKF